jgi:hypothetical protein
MTAVFVKSKTLLAVETRVGKIYASSIDEHSDPE